MDRKGKGPAMSVVVVTVYGADHLRRCLAALGAQEDPPEMEVIAVSDERVSEKDAQAVASEFPSVRQVRIRELTTQEGMRAEGCRLAGGEVVALTVDHCTPGPHWCRRMTDAFDGRPAGAGGCLEFGSQPRTAINLAVHFYDYCNYGYFQRPVARGPARHLSDANAAFRRDVMERYRDIWEDAFHVSFLVTRLLSHGEALFLDPEIIVYQNRDIEASRALRVAYLRGRVFGSRRVARAPAVKRLLYAAFSLLLPLFLLGRFAANVLRKRSHLGSIMKAAPYIVMLAASWSLGECLGYATGSAAVPPGQTYD